MTHESENQFRSPIVYDLKLRPEAAGMTPTCEPVGPGVANRRDAPGLHATKMQCAMPLGRGCRTCPG